MIASGLRRRSQARASVPAIPIVPSVQIPGGLGSIHQPPHEILLREAIGIVDTATRAIANRVASLDLEVYVERRVEDGTTVDEAQDDHPLTDLFRKPHPNFTAGQLFGLASKWVTTVGEAYWLKVGNGFGVPAELHPMPPGRVDPIVRQNVVAGYEVTDGDGRKLTVPADAMVRFWFPDPENPWRSEGYFGPNAAVADSRRFASEHLRKHYQNNATPPLALQGKPGAQDPNEDQRAAFQTAWEQLYSRRFGSVTGAPAIIPAFYDIVQLTMQTGAEITPLLEHWRDELLMAYGVPKSVLGMVVSGDRSSAETNQWVFDLYTVTPIATLIAQSLTSQLAPDFDAKLRVRFKRFVSEDKEYELKREAQDLEHGVRTINEVREARADDPVPWGKKPLMSSKLGPYDPDAKPKPEASGEEPDDTESEENEDDPERIERKLHAGIRRLARRQRRAS